MKARLASALSVVLFALDALPAVAQSQVWIRQFGTSSQDLVQAATPDGSGGVYVCGSTAGSFGGTNAGSDDAWVARCDAAGSRTWVRQFGTSFGDYAYASAPDGSGGVYVCGVTGGSFWGPNAGYVDAWLTHYDGAGNQTWIRQLGTSGWDLAYACATDAAGGVYVCGQTDSSLGATSAGSNDVWLARYDSAGGQTWIRQFGTSSVDNAYAATPDGAGGVYVAGFTAGSLGAPGAGLGDAWLARFDGAGNPVWIRQFGSVAGDGARCAAPDGSGGVYLSGDTAGDLGGPNAGGYDVWLARFDGTGVQTWIRQLGTSAADLSWALAPDGTGGVHVSGSTEDSLSGPNAGLEDAWLAHYDGTGNRNALLQLGSNASDRALAVAHDGWGGVFVGGDTGGSLAGPSAGGADAWLARYEPPCGVSWSYCSAGTTTHGCVPSIASSGSASASAGSGFTIAITNVEGAQSGLVFYGLSGPNAVAWGTSASFLCVKSPLERTTVQDSGGTYAACDGVLSLDWNQYVATTAGALGTPFAGGESVWAQGWFRDPPAPKTTNLSNGLTFLVCP